VNVTLVQRFEVRMFLSWKGIRPGNRVQCNDPADQLEQQAGSLRRQPRPSCGRVSAELRVFPRAPAASSGSNSHLAVIPRANAAPRAGK
jgi:hypothetical protein